MQSKVSTAGAQDRGRTVEELERELAEAHRREVANADVLKVISRSDFDLRPVFETLAESAVRLCEAERAFIFRFDGQLLRVVATHNVRPEFRAWVERNPIAPGRHSATARTALERRTIHIADVMADPDYTYGAKQVDPIRTVLTVPMLRGEKMLGVLLIYRHEVLPFTARQVALMETFADQAVIAIENTRLFEEVQARTHELSKALEQKTATSEVLSVISSSPTETGPVFQAIVTSAKQLLDGYSATLTELRGHELHLSAFTPTDEHNDAALRRAYPQRLENIPLVSQAIHSTEATFVSDTETDPRFEPWRELARLRGYRSLLSVPLLREEMVIGFLYVTRREVGLFSSEEISLLQTFADQAVIAIENTRLFEEVQARTRELTEALEQQTATSEVLGVISSSGELGRVFQAMLANATRLCQAGFGILWLREEGATFRCGALHNVPSAFAEARRQQPTIRSHPDTPVGRVLRTKQADHTVDITSEQSVREGFRPMVDLADFGGARTVLAVPMLKDNEVIGVIGIYRQEVQPFAEKQIELVTNFANQAVIAIENTRLLNELREFSAAADRHRRRAQGHQPLGVRSTGCSGHAC